MSASDSSARADTFNVEQLSDVRDRVARMEGQMASLATKEDVAGLNEKVNNAATKTDVANAKFQLVATWTGTAITILIGVAVILAGVLNTGS